MKNKVHLVLLSSILIFCYSLKVTAQLGSCSGNSGDPIFKETFGAGETIPLPGGTTSYSYTNRAPIDGAYNVSSNTNWFGWHDIADHTSGDSDGRMLVLNADFTSGEFYRTAISGLCENTTYEFSSWMINLLPTSRCDGFGIPINVKFEIWDNTDTNLLASGDTGDINGTSSPNWQQYALVFKTAPSQTSIILKMLNNGVGGCGNDLALDDIVFKSCGDTIAIEDAFAMNMVTVCADALPFSTILTAKPDFTIFSSHFYQWQNSTDGINWIDIPGETNNSYSTKAINNTVFYRVKVAESVINVNNDSCNSSSEIYEVKVIPFPKAPSSNGDLTICENITTPLSVSIPAGVLVNWYDANIGGNLLAANSTSYKPSISGIYYAETETVLGGCTSASRTPIKIDYSKLPEVVDESISICENENLTLNGEATDPSIVAYYLWSSGETSSQIEVSSPGTYSVQVSNGSCTVTKTIILSQINNPIIKEVTSSGSDIIITTSNKGDFLYAINGSVFQSNSTFSNIEGGQYTISVKHRNCDQIITAQHIHFYIPRFFTPNGDNINDTFNLKGIEFYSYSQVSIFNRYGKLLKYAENTPFSWNGTLNGQLLQTTDYWYVIIIENQRFTGHITLKR